MIKLRSWSNLVKQSAPAFSFDTSISLTPANRDNAMPDSLPQLAPVVMMDLMERRSWLRRKTYDLTWLLVRWLGWLLFGLRLRGGDRFPPEGGALVCSNHQSFLDPVLVGALAHRRMNYLARQDLFDTPLFGTLIRWYDAIPVQRDGMGIGGIKETLRRLKRGEMVLLFPEGTRTEDGELIPLKSGFCMLAHRAQVPLVPVGIDGAYDAWPRHRKLPRPRKICLVAGPPITAQQVAKLTDEELVKLLEQRIQQCHTTARRMRDGDIGA